MFEPEFYRKPNEVFTPVVIAAAKAHAIACFPQESCGIVRSGRYVPCKNVSPEPTEAFKVSPITMGKAFRAGDLEGIIHSHPMAPWWPSKADMAAQIETGVPWAIIVAGEAEAELACHWGGVRPPVFHDGLHVPRSFLHGVSDCYSMVRDYYAEMAGLQLSEFPRDWEWWVNPETPKGMYLDNFEEQGFEVVSTNPMEYASIAKPHDAYLMPVRSKVPNHAGIYIGNGQLLEHMHGNLSHREPIARKLKHITHWLRPKG